MLDFWATIGKLECFSHLVWVVSYKSYVLRSLKLTTYYLQLLAPCNFCLLHCLSQPKPYCSGVPCSTHLINDSEGFCVATGTQRNEGLTLIAVLPLLSCNQNIKALKKLSDRMIQFSMVKPRLIKKPVNFRYRLFLAIILGYLDT